MRASWWIPVLSLAGWLLLVAWWAFLTGCSVSAEVKYRAGATLPASAASAGE